MGLLCLFPGRKCPVASQGRKVAEKDKREASPLRERKEKLQVSLEFKEHASFLLLKSTHAFSQGREAGRVSK
jgi:hypothetical protein